MSGYKMENYDTNTINSELFVEERSYLPVLSVFVFVCVFMCVYVC